MSSGLALEVVGAHGGRWKRYPAYKDSGVEWLGVVPEGWDVERLKYCAARINEKVDGRESDLPYTGLEHIESWTGRLTPSEEISTSEGQSSRYEPGDVLFGKLRPYLAKAFRAKEHGICTGELLVLRPKDVSQDYLFSYVLARDFISIVDSSTYGAKMPRASWDFIGDLPVLLPSEAEQHAIAAFLDRETGRIDALIAKKERQIELLREKRAALISHAVTKGLNPNEVSASIRWIEARLRRFIKLQRGFDISGASECDGPYPVFSSGGLSGHSDIAPVSGPGVIVGRKGTLGTVYYSANNYWPHDTTLWVKEFGGNYPKFVYYFLIHMRLERFDVGAANPTLNRNHIHPIKVRFPDSTSQKVISDFLDGGVTAIENVKQTISESVILLKEYRTALISTAVTGKIDVREELVS